MTRFLEDMLCGLLGYGMGKRNREFTQEEVELPAHQCHQKADLEAKGR